MSTSVKAGDLHLQTLIDSATEPSQHPIVDDAVLDALCGYNRQRVRLAFFTRLNANRAYLRHIASRLKQEWHHGSGYEKVMTLVALHDTGGEERFRIMCAYSQYMGWRQVTRDTQQLELVDA